MIPATARLKTDPLPCDLCEGAREVDCLQCGGSGTTGPIGGPASTCPSCSGEGAVPCPECTGRASAGGPQRLGRA